MGTTVVVEDAHAITLKQKANSGKSFKDKKALSKRVENMLQSYGLVDNDSVDTTVADFSKFVDNVKLKLDFTSSDEHSEKENEDKSRSEQFDAEKSVDKLFTQLGDSEGTPKPKKKKKKVASEGDEPTTPAVASFLKTPPPSATSAFFRKAAGTKTEKLDRKQKLKKSALTPKSE